MIKFIQIIEYETEHPDEVIALMNRSSAAQPDPQGGFTRFAVTQDRGNLARYLVIVEFPSYEQAMANSAEPEVGEMAQQMARLLTRGPIYHNLDVLRITP